MPAKSKRQWRFMKMIEAGDKKVKGLSPAVAAEYTKENNYKKLPEKVKKKK